jgi:hypothetical protein
MSVVLETLKKNQPENPVIGHCIEVQGQLTWYLNKAKERLNRNDFTAQDATALAMIVDRGMHKMIRIVEGDESASGG